MLTNFWQVIELLFLKLMKSSHVTGIYSIFLQIMRQTRATSKKGIGGALSKGFPLKIVEFLVKMYRGMDNITKI